MNKLLLLCAVILISMTACDSTKEEDGLREQITAKITELEGKLYKSDPNNPQLDRPQAVDVIRYYKQYADSFPEDSVTPEYLFKGGEVGIALQQHQLAINLFDRVVNAYSNHKRAPESLFLKAFVLDNYLQAKGQAKGVYEAVIAKYPDHKLAQDAEASIQNLYMSDEDLIKMFQEKNKEDTLAADSVLQ